MKSSNPLLFVLLPENIRSLSTVSRAEVRQLDCFSHF
jgi:hypothetical protein